MVVFKKLMVGAAAMSLASMPVAASAADASKLSLSSQARAGKTVKAGEDLAGGGVIVAILAAAAVIAGIVIVADEDDEPNSP